MAATERKPKSKFAGAQRQDRPARTSTAERREKSKRGFASMDPERVKEIASQGGKAAHAQGRAHEWTADSARVAGRKGGTVVSTDRAHMAEIGRKGGQAKGAKRAVERDGDRP